MPESKKVIANFQHPSSTQPLKLVNTSQHQENIFFVNGVKILIVKYKDVPALQPLDCVIGHCMLIFAKGGIINKQLCCFYVLACFILTAYQKPVLLDQHHAYLAHHG